MTSAMDPVYGLVKMGSSVDIQRSDGRIHSAVVSDINTDTRTITVEWSERGEAKGKEIDLDCIFKLNPDVAPQEPQAASAPAVNTRLTRYNSRQSRMVNNNIASTNIRQSYMTSSVATSSAGVISNVQNNNNNGTAAVAASNARCIDADRQSDQPLPPPTRDVNGGGANGGPGGSRVSVAAGAGAGGNATTAGGRKCSNVVKEVEKLQKKREQRREKQNKKREEREALMNVDPGNPNWEFLAMIREYQSSLEFRPLKDGDPLQSHQITVCVRKRPLSKKELARKEVDVITIPNRDQTIVHEPRTKVDLTKFLENQHFRFDYAFDDSCDNTLVYKYCARPLVDTVFDGGMATCFAYGQTGSGKTHTMGGTFNGRSQDANKGIYAMTARDVFTQLRQPAHAAKNLAVSASYFEIYSGKVFDLLNGKAKLRVLEDGRQQVQVVGLTERSVTCMEDVLRLIQHGNGIRTSGQTSANNHSSRSHAVFQLLLRPAGAGAGDKAARRLYGKFSLIDLAGNERGADTSSSDRTTRMEGAEINKSLLALKECIRALGRKGGHLPFRASKLTQVLRDSFIGEKSKTCMIAMISPGLNSCEHSLNTLRYADRVKELGAQDPSEMGGDYEPAAAGTAASAGPSVHHHNDDVEVIDDDLAQLRSLNAFPAIVSCDSDGDITSDSCLFCPRICANPSLRASSTRTLTRSRSEGELSVDLYNFHEAVSHLQLMEEQVLELHKNWVDQTPRWQQLDVSLLRMTNEVDYDVDAYVQQLKDLLDEKIDVLTRFRQKVTAYSSQLLEEEAISRNIQLPHRR